MISYYGGGRHKGPHSCIQPASILHLLRMISTSLSRYKLERCTARCNQPCSHLCLKTPDSWKRRANLDFPNSGFTMAVNQAQYCMKEWLYCLQYIIMHKLLSASICEFTEALNFSFFHLHFLLCLNMYWVEVAETNQQSSQGFTGIFIELRLPQTTYTVYI